MAKVADVFISGSMGNLVFYRRMGTHCVRTQALDVKQSPATKMRSVNFGIAARAGKALRGALAPCMPNATDRSMQSRFSGAIAKWLGRSPIADLPATESVPFLAGFEFTTGQPVIQRCKVSISISFPQENLVAVSIDSFVPAKQISAPAGTGLVSLVISVAGCMLETGMASGSETHTIDVPFNETMVSAQVLEFYVGASAPSLLVTAARLIYKRREGDRWRDMNKEAFMPAGVIDARYVG